MLKEMPRRLILNIGDQGHRPDNPSNKLVYFWVFGEPSEHDADHGEFDEGHGASDFAFVVSCQSPASADPGEGSLDDPSFWQRHEALLRLRAFNNL